MYNIKKGGLFMKGLYKSVVSWAASAALLVTGITSGDCNSGIEGYGWVSGIYAEWK